jgi:hypothetical protein
LIKSKEYQKGLLRVLPHASLFAKLALADKSHAHISGLIYLARLFQYAGYGKSERFAIFLAMLQLEDPANVHFKTSESLLQHALRKIEQATEISSTTEALGIIPNQRSLYHFEVAALRDLRALYRFMSDSSRSRMITPQIYTLHRDADNEQGVQYEQENIRRDVDWENTLRTFRRGAYILAPIILLKCVLCLLLLEDGMDLLLLLAVGYTFTGSWWMFMYSWRHRRKALAVLILSSFPLTYRSRSFGPWIFLYLEPPFLLMALSTIPVLYYQGLSPEAPEVTA